MDNPANEILQNLAELYQQGRTQEMLDACRQLILEFPNSPALLSLAGAAHVQTRDFEQARDAFASAARLRPNDAVLQTNLGVALSELGQFEDAIAAYHRAQALDPSLLGAHYNLARMLHEIDRFDDAITAYQRVLQLQPNDTDALNNLGAIYAKLQRREEAIACYTRALAIEPSHGDACYNLGGVYVELHSRDEAIEWYDRALKIEPHHELARTERLHQQAYVCDWDGISADVQHIPSLGIAGKAIPPFTMLALEDEPERQRIRAERFAKQYVRPPMFAHPKPAKRPERLRIGYFSGDFHNHATMHLMARLFETHDRSRFSLHAFSYGAQKPNSMRARAEAAFDHFHDMRGLSDKRAAVHAYEEHIDIAVDLKGHTADGRLGVLAYRPAPIQVSYLGYPGTTGAPFIDYLIADSTLVTPANRAGFSENIVYLPGSYQVNDDTRAIATLTITRAQAGLPENGFVFCCFNSAFKISPTEFDIWMRLLGRIEDSSLWLFKENDSAAANLRMQAQRRGVDPNRIVFADRAAHADHLARHRLADLFLDTFNCNAHTTASDALWAGLPIVTKAGKGLAARVAASLLQAMELPELITQSQEDYENLALALATDRAKLERIRAKLAANRTKSTLFDTRLFARRLESAYDQIYARYLEGEPPSDLVIAP